MRKFYLFALIILAFTLSEQAIANTKVQAADEIYRIQNIKIENKSDDLVAGKQIAIDDGKRIAFDELMKRFVNYGYIDKEPTASFAQIDDAIKSVEVIEELITEKMYEARMNYRFEPKKILKFLDVKSVGVLPEKEVYLVVPVLKEGSKVSPWQPTWLSAWKKNPAQSIILPFGDLQDLKTVREEDLSVLNYTGLDKLARRYKTPVVIMAEAEYDIPKNMLHVRLKRFESEPKLVAEYKYPGEFGIGSKELFFTATQDVVERIKKDGISRNGEGLKNPLADQEIDIKYSRDYQSELSEDQKSLQATVITRSLSDWSAVRRKLINTKLIKNLNVNSFSSNKTNIKIFYIGEIDELRRSLATNGLTITQDGENFIINRL